MNEMTKEFVRLFNEEQDFYECHEIFELAWKNADDPEEAVFYKALVQVATAQFKLKKGVLRGVRKLFACAFPELSKLPPMFQGIDIDRLRRDFGRQYSALPKVEEIGEGRYQEYGLSVLHLYLIDDVQNDEDNVC